MRTVLTDSLKGIYYALLRPSKLVAVPNPHADRSLLSQLRQARALVIVYLLNLALYAGPLTVAGIGIQSESSVPNWIRWLIGTDPGPVMLYVSGFIQNSVYLLGFTVATLVAIHVALLITFQSNGLLRTAYSVVYSTSAYVAGIFTVVWYLATTDGVESARNFVIDVQVAFIYTIIDYIGANIEYTVPRPETISAANFSQLGEYGVISLVVLIGYFFYSLYLGARINHDAGRFASLIAILVVISLPIGYVIGSIIIAA